MSAENTAYALLYRDMAMYNARCCVPAGETVLQNDMLWAELLC